MKHVATKNERDKQVIEALLWRLGPLSRAQMHDLTHLQPSDITGLVRQLLREGRLVPAGRADNPKGRKQALLRLNQDLGFVVGVAFDDQDVLAAAFDLRLQTRSNVKEAADLCGGREGFVRQLLRCTRAAIQQAGIEPRQLLGIGVAGSGLINNREGMLVMSSTIDFLREVPLREILERELGVATLVENLTRAKTLAERSLGAGEVAPDMAYVEYGRTGIGAGIVIGGKLFYGSGYAAGELGHTHMMEGGPACKCGSFGCLEAIAGASALEARIRKALVEGIGSEVLAVAGGDSAKIEGWTVLQAASQGDKACAAIVEQAGNYLGLGLANLVNLFNPSMLVLDQRLSLAGDALLDQITRIVKRQALGHSAKDLVVRFGKLGSEAGILGAGLLVLEKHFEIPALKPLRFLVEATLAGGAPALAAPGSLAAAYASRG